MAKEVIALGLGGGAVCGVRLAESGKAWDVAAAQAWALETSAEEHSEDASASQDATAEDSGAEGEQAPPADALAEALTAAAKHFHAREVTLAIPLSCVLMRTVSVTAEESDLLETRAADAIAGASPFPDEELVVGAERVSEGERAVLALAAALPSAAAEDADAALVESKLQTVRTDVLFLGWLRALWPRLFPADAKQADRRLVLSSLDDGWDLAVFDAGSPVLLRNLGHDESALSREILLSLLQCPGADPGEVVICSRGEPSAAVREACAAYGTIRAVQVSEEDICLGIEGCALRTVEGASFDITPLDWSARLRESRFRRKLVRSMSVAAALWGLAMGVLFGVPFVFGQLAEREKAASRHHAKAYREVKDMRDRVRLVQRYSDRARGALEMLKLSSDRLPDGITLTSWQYKRGENVRLSGEAEQPTQVYEFKNALVKSGVFADVRLTGPSASRGGKQRFDVDAVFEEKEEK